MDLIGICSTSVADTVWRCRGASPGTIGVIPCFGSSFCRKVNISELLVFRRLTTSSKPSFCKSFPDLMNLTNWWWENICTEWLLI